MIGPKIKMSPRNHKPKSIPMPIIQLTTMKFASFVTWRQGHEFYTFKYWP